MQDWAQRNCPVCQSGEKRLLYEQRFHSLKQGSPIEGYDVVVCANCGMSFADRIPPVEVFDDFYHRLSRAETGYTGSGDSVWDVERFAMNADFLDKNLPGKNLSILDVGCGTGGFLIELKNRGYSNLAGLDPSAGCAGYMKEHHSIPVHKGTFVANELEPKSFDVVMALGVLEHLPELQLSVKALIDLVADDGFIFVEVPDSAAFQKHSDAPYQQFSIEHINFFARQSTINLFDKYGFAPKCVEVGAIPMSQTTLMPEVSALFGKRQSGGGDFKMDIETEPALKEYIRVSANEELRVANMLQGLADANNELIVWGAGTHTLHLLESSSLGACNIAAFVDSNAQLHGQELNGRPIVAPRDLLKYPHPVLISSRVFQHDIANQIRQDLAAPNELILLYDVSGR